MKIIKLGNIPEEIKNVVRFDCTNCRTVFEETFNTATGYVKTTCPLCKKKIKIYLGEGGSDLWG